MEPKTELDAMPWKRPDEVMRLHRLKLKKKALQARITRTDQVHLSSINDHKQVDSALDSLISTKRKNPFKCESSKKFKGDNDADVTSESSLFQLLSDEQPRRESRVLNESISLPSFLREVEESESPLHQRINIPIDWSLKAKIRLISPKPFPWSHKLRTCEEASGITGYVRCLDTSQPTVVDGECISGQSLDTSPNARFHQCGLYWQHPSLPWLPLFPRTRGEGSSSGSAGAPSIALDPTVKECLHQEWCESFRSLFQLVRARQCPFFYLCANSFTCLFRAAGVAGVPEMHALLTPTTRGFRAALKEEDVVFSMPLKKSSEGKTTQGRTSDEGYDTLNSTLDDFNGEKTKRNSSSPITDDKGERLKDTNAEDDIDMEGIGGEEDEEEEASEWLEKMGVTEAEIKRMESEQAKHIVDRERDFDRKPESLVYVEGIEAQALFNFLMDCRSCVSPTGPLAGIPPTLFAPVAFRGATLGALKVRHSVVKVEGESFYSVELRGPILPNTIHSLSSLLCSSSNTNPTFSATFAGIHSTRAFSLATGKSSDNKSELVSSTASSVTASVFEKESLSDCGLVPSILEAFCQACNSFTLDNLKFSDSVYSWSSSL